MASPLIESLKRLYAIHKITKEKVINICESHNFSEEEQKYILGEEE